MNKYQESLDFIVKNSCHSHMPCKQCYMNQICNNLVKPHIDRLQELIDEQEQLEKIGTNKAYILHESYGSYEDLFNPPMIVYIDKEKAKDKCDKLNKQLEELKNTVSNVLSNSDITGEALDKKVEEITNGQYDYYLLEEQNNYFISECKLEI